MVAQSKFLNAVTGAITTGGRVVNEISLQRAANVHGLMAEVNIESEAMEANSNGSWQLYAFPGDVITANDTLSAWDQWDNENITQYLWGSGLWMASNQTPFHTMFKPSTTRNLPKSGRVMLVVHVEGTLPVLTNNRVNTLLKFFISQ